ncbi:MAG TPA: ATP-binding cassette domain-containing protein, partial [Burkholderiales bacterium]|nr:ATP-binding cassette domain-containing protein [Burkholderiales bacterium]
SLDAGERVALIGRNGSGKTSLLKVLAGERALDDGKLWRKPELRLAFVAQEPPLDLEHSVFEAVASGFGALQTTLIEYHKLTHGLTPMTTQAELDRMYELQHVLDHGDGWTINSRDEALIDRFALPADAFVRELSGGYRKRVALAQALAIEPEVLLLDEPTNHLDIAAIEWLQGLLKDYAGAVLFVTHDRRFLDEVATRVIELDRGVLASFPGSYADYQRRKEEMLNAESVANARFDKLLAQEEVWIRQGIKARRTRNEGRVLRLEGLRRERAARRERVGQVSFAVGQGERSGELVAELKDVSKSFGDKHIIRNFSTRILRGDKIGLIGPNGAGKSTLLKLILGELPPDTGTIRSGTRVEVAYFDQLREQLDDNAILIDTISQGAEYIEIGGARKHVMSYLGDFLFRPERARAKVSALSGGERNRLLLARLFSRPANVLVLDEPTNDLDIETLELLESLLLEYTGTLFLVSHDRAFLDNVVTQVIAFEGDGVLREYVGGYSDWERQRAAPESKSVQPAAATKSQSAPRAKDKSTRLSFKESRELEALPDAIAALEREQAQITSELADPTVYKDQPERLKTLQQRFEAIDIELKKSYARWEALEAKSAA